MTTIERALITFVAASLGLALAISAVGAESDNTKILATAYEPMPPGTAADLTVQVVEQMRRQLQNDGYVVSDDSPFVLMIGTAAPPSLNDDVDLPILLSVQDRRSDKYLWRGVANICQCGEGILAASHRIVPDLSGAIGRTIGPQPVAFEALL